MGVFRKREPCGCIYSYGTMSQYTVRSPCFEHGGSRFRKPDAVCPQSTTSAPSTPSPGSAST
jgi:hypothetical protein